MFSCLFASLFPQALVVLCRCGLCLCLVGVFCFVLASLFACLRACLLVCVFVLWCFVLIWFGLLCFGLVCFVLLCLLVCVFVWLGCFVLLCLSACLLVFLALGHRGAALLKPDSDSQTVAMAHHSEEDKDIGHHGQGDDPHPIATTTIRKTTFNKDGVQQDTALQPHELVHILRRRGNGKWSEPVAVVETSCKRFCKREAVPRVQCPKRPFQGP